MNSFEILFFGGLKAHFSSSTSIELGHNATASSLIGVLSAMKPQAKTLLDACIVAVDKKIVAKDYQLKSGHSIAILPPFSGG